MDPVSPLALEQINIVVRDVEFDSVAFAKQWNPGLDEAKLSSAVIPIFHVSAREEVDRVHARMTAAGHRSHKTPEDAFLGARLCHRGGSGRDLGRHHEPDRRVQAPAAALLRRAPDNR